MDPYLILKTITKILVLTLFDILNQKNLWIVPEVLITTDRESVKILDEDLKICCTLFFLVEFHLLYH